MGFILKRDGWQKAMRSRAACGAFVLEVDCSGSRSFFSTRTMELKEFPGGPLICCKAAVLNSPAYTMSIDPYSRSFSAGQVSFIVSTPEFPIARMVRSGQPMERVTAKVRWLVVGEEICLDQSFLLVDGVLGGFSYDERSDTVSFSVVDDQLAGDRQFPPHSVTVESFDPAAIPADSFGKAYPVIVGEAVKVPVIDISADKTRYLVMEDPCGRFTGAPVSAVYDNDTSKGIDAQDEDTDAIGVDYWYVDITGDAATSMDVTVDVDSGIPGNPVEAIFYLLTSFSLKRDLFDLTSLIHVSKEFGAVTLSIVFNQIVEGGVIQAIKSRLMKDLPLAMVQLGSKIHFQSLLWGRDPCKVLSTDTNVLETISAPAEAGLEHLANEFVVRAGLSGLRGDMQTAVKRDKDNDAICLSSFRRRGFLGKKEMDLPDAVTLESATWLMNWAVQTYALNRVRVSYLCTMDVLDVKLWDTVRVYDLNYGWTDGPLFKVIGIQYGESCGIALDLLSVDDWFDVHAVNRKSYESLELLGAQCV